ncbi:PAS domain S-box protein [Singulisphaera sp. PoT]|uniref:PAS domain S-box protein n=1 Tax=Singulisphaera sp. PoT TaxID=3411797 RepID=UPI003BF5A049
MSSETKSEGQRPRDLQATDITDELDSRPSRIPDHASENHTLVRLARALAESPQHIFASIADAALELCGADAAGVTLVDENEDLRWQATAGILADRAGSSVPRRLCPCGLALDRGEGRLLADPGRRFAGLPTQGHPIGEWLTLPFSSSGRAAGTVWAANVERSRPFDGEDRRILAELADFASAAYLTLSAIEQQERASDNRARRILESITDAFFAVDRDWRFTYVNQQAERLLNRKPRDLLGQSLWDEYPGLAGSDFERSYHRAAEERVAESVTAYYPDHDRWYEVHVYPTADGISIYFRDASERVRADEAIRASEERFRLALDSAELGAWHVDPKTMKLTTDARFRAIFGTDQAALGYEQAIAMIHPDDRSMVRAEVQLATRPSDPKPYAVEHRVIHPDGSVRWVFAKGRANLGRNGVRGLPLSFDGTLADITERKRAEEALRANEERYRTFFDNIDEGFCVIEVLLDDEGRPFDYRFLEMNPAFETHTGLRNALGKRVRDLVPQHETHWYEIYGKVASTGEPIRFMHEAKALNRWYEVSASRVGEPSSRKVAVLFNDISDRVHAESRLRDALSRLDAALEAGTIATWDWEIADDRVTGDRNLARMFSVPVEVVNGGGLSISQFLAAIHPHDRERVTTLIEQTLATGRRYETDYRILSPDGEVRWVEARGRVVRDDQGQPTSLRGVVADITDRKRSEEATRLRAFQLQKLAEVANQINSAHDVNSVLRVVTEEARQLVGAHQAATSMVLDPLYPQPVNVVSASARPGQDVTPPDIDGLLIYEDLERTNRPIRLTHGEIDSDPRWNTLGKLTGLGTTPNGWLAAPLIGRNGRNMGLIQLSDKFEGEFTADDEAILIQLSQLTAIAVENARLYEELRGNDERKDEFLAMLAHELRNPLAAISNAVKLTAKTDEKQHLDWSRDVINRQMLHLSRLIDDLMDVSRITRGKIDLRRDVVEATSILESAAATVRTLLEERKHTLDLDLERGHLWLNVDPTRLEQVVVNLLNNAAKYSENSGHIRLRARKEGDEVVISVKDRGVGIPPEKLPEMFELFAQGDRSLARSEGGLGIGLTVVKKLVEMHGGGIAARSEGPGQGSEFTIRLPAAQQPAPTRDDAGPSPLKPARKAKVLVVDDNVDTAKGMARLLKLIGHEVATAHSGPEAIEVARAYDPDFILLDIGLPGMSGYEVASQLRREPCCEGSVIVAVSGYGQDEDRRRSRQAGFDHHLIKPLDHDALLSLLAAGNDRG